MLNKYNVGFNLEDIKKRKAVIEKKYHELEEMFKNFQNILEETKDFYDTPSSKKYYFVASQYLDISFLYLNNSFKPVVAKLDKVINEYNNFNMQTNSLIEGNDHHEV